MNLLPCHFINRLLSGLFSVVLENKLSNFISLLHSISCRDLTIASEESLLVVILMNIFMPAMARPDTPACFSEVLVLARKSGNWIFCYEKLWSFLIWSVWNNYIFKYLPQLFLQTFCTVLKRTKICTFDSKSFRHWNQLCTHIFSRFINQCVVSL